MRLCEWCGLNCYCTGIFYVPVDSMCELRYDGRVSLKKGQRNEIEVSGGICALPVGSEDDTEYGDCNEKRI